MRESGTEFVSGTAFWCILITLETPPNGSPEYKFT